MLIFAVAFAAKHASLPPWNPVYMLSCTFSALSFLQDSSPLLRCMTLQNRHDCLEALLQGALTADLKCSVQMYEGCERGLCATKD